MRKTELIIAYLYNKSVQADRELEQIKYNLRGREADEADMLECIISKTRADTINEVLLKVLQILDF